LGTTINFSGDEILSSEEPCLILLNHRTYFDWLFFWFDSFHFH